MLKVGDSWSQIQEWPLTRSFPVPVVRKHRGWPGSGNSPWTLEIRFGGFGELLEFQVSRKRTFETWKLPNLTVNSLVNQIFLTITILGQVIKKGSWNRKVWAETKASIFLCKFPEFFQSRFVSKFLQSLGVGSPQLLLL